MTTVVQSSVCRLKQFENRTTFLSATPTTIKMKIVVILIAILVPYVKAQLHCGDNIGDPNGRSCCPANHGVHLAQSEPFNGKVFLLPWGKDNRRGDWLYNYGLCQSVCAEMVTIHSDKENKALISYLRTFDLGSPGAWLGGQFGYNTTFLSRSFAWINGEDIDYNNFRSSEPDTYGHSCLNILYSTADADLEKWWSYPCTETALIAVCQKHIST